MKKIIVILIGLLVSSSAFADGKVICGSGWFGQAAEATRLAMEDVNTKIKDYDLATEQDLLLSTPVLSVSTAQGAIAVYVCVSVNTIEKTVSK